MPFMHNPAPDRRAVLVGALAIAGAHLLPSPAIGGITSRQHELRAGPGRAPLVGPPHPDTAVWCYDGRVPGPELRLRQGERLRVTVENRLAEPTTVHWHGIRLPNAMDGVPHLTQEPIAPGGSFTYEFDCPDAGTFWYHPHQRSFEQVGRGLAGVLIVEEPTPVAVDRDIVWALGDWRLRDDASLNDDFGNLHDAAHAGRIGNTVTVNGRILEEVPVRAGERIRLRLVNTANARIFGLVFGGHAPLILAVDGQPVAPFAPRENRIVLGPAQRIDLLLDLAGRPGQRFQVTDTFYRGLEYRLLDLAYTEEPPLRGGATAEPLKLPPNPLPEPDPATAERHEIVLGGGMMGGMTGGMMDGRRVDMRTMMHNGLAWTVNGMAARGPVHEPLLTFERGRSYLLALANDTAWPHPMHLHGHAFRTLSRNGESLANPLWQDTILLMPRERAEIAVVADNSGDWMFHCHILEHQMAGMMAVIRVA